MKLPPGLVITYNPTPDFRDCLDSLCGQLDLVVLVDNGSGPGSRRLLEQEGKRRKSSLVLLRNDTNLGIATALNQGFQWAIHHGYNQIIAFDQDSRPAPGMLPAMLDVFNSYSKRGKPAVVASVIEDPLVNVQARFPRPRYRFFFERAHCDGRVLEDISIAITSGSLYDLDAYQKLGPFRDDFFIDYVDTEYCLRARRHGYRIVAACDAHVYHRLGERQRRNFWGSVHFPTFHIPLRWYYISRNRIPMLRMYAFRFPHWFWYELIASAYGFIRMLSFEDHVFIKLLAVFYGTLDGILGRMGKISPTAQAAIRTRSIRGRS